MLEANKGCGSQWAHAGMQAEWPGKATPTRQTHNVNIVTHMGIYCTEQRTLFTTGWPCPGAG